MVNMLLGNDSEKSQVKILYIYNHYGTANPSGETKAFYSELANLEEVKDEAVEIYRYEKRTDDVAKMNYFLRFFEYLLIPFNFFEYLKIRKQLKVIKPDVVHVFNSWPFITPAAFAACKNYPIVLTAPNYRLGCPAGIPMRGGQVCTKCIDSRNPLWAAIHRCYRGNFFASIYVAITTIIMKICFIKKIAKVIVLSGFQREMFLRMGFRDDQIEIKVTPLSLDIVEIIPYSERSIDLAFFGRLSEEKGVLELLSFWETSSLREDYKLHVFGGGPLQSEVDRKCQKLTNTVFRGQASEEEAVKYIGQSRLVLVPSRWFEGLPLVMQESFGLGTPLLVSDVGLLRPSWSKRG